MKTQRLFIRISWLLLLPLFIAGNVLGQTTTIDFETAGDGYAPSGTEGSGSTDVFNRANPDIGGNSSYIWAAEDLSLTDPSIVLDNIDISGATSFDFSVDLLTQNTNDWDVVDEVLITYTVDGGAEQNLMWIQSNDDGDNYNAPAALDLDFNGTGDDGEELPALNDGFGAGVGSNFATFSNTDVPVAGTTLSITIQYIGLTSAGEGLYMDNLVITQNTSSVTPTKLAIASVTPSSPEVNESFSVTVQAQDSNGEAGNVDQDTEVQLSKQSGTGNLSGTLTGTITSGTHSIAISGLTYDVVESMDIKASVNSGMSLSASSLKTITFQEQTQEPVAGDLIITEVVGEGVDGGADNGYMEIYNQSSKNLSLDNVEARYYNSNPGDFTQTVPLSGNLAPGAYVVVTQESSEFLNTYGISADYAGSDFYFNGGDDGCDVYHTTNGIIDQFNDNGTSASPWTWNDNNVFERDTTASGALQSSWNENADGNGTPKAMNSVSFLSTAWEGGVDNLWSSAGNWNNGVPDANTDVTIPTGASINIVAKKATADCYNLTIQQGGDLTIGGTLNVNNHLMIQGNASGKGSMINNGTLNLSGQAKVEQYLAETSQSYNWHYVITPVDGATMSLFPGAAYNSNNIYASEWDEANDTWNNITSDDALAIQKGYAVPLDAGEKVSFNGNLISGTQTISGLSYTGTSTYSGFHLIGNPFTAAMDISQLTGTNWTEDVWVRSDGDFQEYNVASGSGTLSNGIVPALQGFWVRVNSGGGSVELDPATLTHNSTNLYKSADLKGLHLSITRGKYTDETVLYADKNANDGYDRYDTEKRFADNEAYPQIYTTIEGHKLAINGVSNIDTKERRISMGFKSEVAGEFTLNMENVQAFENYSDAYLKDNETGETIDLNEDNTYAFETTGGVNQEGRFTIVLSTEQATAISQVGTNGVNVWANDHNLYVHSREAGVASIRIHDIAGKVIYSGQHELQGGIKQLPLNKDAGMYVVQVKMNGKTSVQKIILK